MPENNVQQPPPTTTTNPPAPANPPVDPPAGAGGQPNNTAPANPPAAGGDDDLKKFGKVDGRGNLIIPSNAVKRLKEEQRLKGKKDAQAALETQAKELGFASYEAMVRHLKNGKPAGGQPAAPQNAQPKPGEEPGQGGKGAQVQQLQKKVQQLERQLAEEQKLRRSAVQKGKRLQAEIDDLQVDGSMKMAAVQAGAKDVDYVLGLMRRRINSMPPEQVEKGFDEGDFFKELRKDKPYLFGEVTVPANTGTTPNTGTPPGGKPAGGAPPAPNGKPATPGQVQNQQNQNGQFDASKAPIEDVKARAAKLGVKWPTM